jgi:hypothetical protein
MIMHHIAPCTPCIALFNCDHLLHIRVDHEELESGFQAEQVRWVFIGPQAPSCEGANIVGSGQAPVHLTNDPCLLHLNLALCSFMIVY